MSPIVLLVLVLLVPAVWGVVEGIRTVTEPQAFAKFSNVSGGFSGRTKPGGRYTFGLVYGPLPDVTMSSARLVVTEGSVAAATTVSICRAQPDHGQGTGIGIAEGDVSVWCSEVTPVAGQDLGQLGPDDSLIATVVPLVNGRVQVTGVDLAYDQGSRHATERIVADFDLD